MLKTLHIKNFILLDEVKIDFTQGFNVLCGETGAGKSIIIKALDCVLGEKVNKEMILNKDLPCFIEAVFENNNRETVISREISTTSKFRLNGILSSLDEIKELRETLVDIHSQHQTYTYMAQKHHIVLLDDYIIKKNPEFFELIKTYKENYLEYRENQKKLRVLKENYEQNSHDIELLKFQLQELDEAEIKENEEEELKEELNILSNVQELKEETYSAYYALYGDNQSIIEALSKIKCMISSLSELDKNLKDSESILFDSFENLKDTANFLKDYSSNLELNPNRIDELNERISLIQSLKRKYGNDLEQERNNIEEKLKVLTSSDNNLEALEEKINELTKTCDILAEKISEYRTKNAKELSVLIENKLKELELKEAQFNISVRNCFKNESGCDFVEFLIATNKNQNPMPMSNVASGGEISRVMLALKTIFASVDKVATVVFDEIDTGISGITSNSVANALIELAKSTQIICITHQPIICAKADNFIWITKTHNENTNIKIEILDDERKLKALAQMASGEVTQQTIDFAKTLVKN